MNLKIREMIVTLREYIESVDLPPEAKRMAIKEIYDEAVQKADDAVRTEIAERNAIEREEACKSAKSSGSKAISSETLG